MTCTRCGCEAALVSCEHGVPIYKCSLCGKLIQPIRR